MPRPAAPRALLALAALRLLAPCSAGGGLRAAGRVALGDAEAALAAELRGGRSEERLRGLEDALRGTFTALPKDADGRLGHLGVRYVLHRLFVQRRGWYVKGLEPGAEAPQEEWVPSFLQSRLEQELAGRGATLRDLAVLSAAIEDLIRQEAAGRLEAVYGMHGLSARARLDKTQAEQVITTFYVAFLTEGDFNVTGSEEVERAKQLFAQEYTGWTESVEWLKGIVATAMESELAPGDEEYSYEVIERVALDIGDNYYKFNDLECQALKAEMKGLESRKAGRVRLPEFYKKALYSHWRFDEKLEYLRTLGAADETEQGNPLVILPNYLTARTNCLEATGIYAVCCRNECEDLMGRLEAEVAAPEATPAELIELVSAMPSDTVRAPRELPAQLRQRLFEVAAGHGGAVPLHGRLFAQWMHHAFPRECPYPHEMGTTSPQTAEEWMRASGQATHKLERDQLEREVEVDTCAVAPDGGPTLGCGRAEELPWSEAEELLAGGAARGAPRPPGALLAAGAAAALLAALAVGHLPRRQWKPQGLLDELPLRATGGPLAAALGLVRRERVCVAVGALSLAGYAAGVLDLLAVDGALLLLGVGAGLARLAIWRGTAVLRLGAKVAGGDE